MTNLLLTILFILFIAFPSPGRADSLIYNPGIEDGKTYPQSWWTYNTDLDRETDWIKGVAHSGNHSIRIENTTGTDAHWCGGTVTFPEPYPHTLTLGGWARAEDVAPGGIFAIGFYIKFEDGNHTWYYDDLLFRPGTHDWENIESKVTFDKAVKQIQPYCLLSYTTGTAWFDDVYAFLEGDRDGDGLHDEEEQAIGTGPDNPDTDHDGMPDGWEVKYGLNPLINDAIKNLDGDGYTNIGEYNSHTDPGDPNSKPRDMYDSLIYNPGMEDGKTYPQSWWTYNTDLDRETDWIKGVAHSGNHSIRIENTTSTDVQWCGGTVIFPEPYPHTLTLGGWAKAEDVAPGGIFAILFYIKFEDGNHTWYYDDLLFRPGTHDWENTESKVTFDKAVKQIKPYCFLSYTTGTAWFDDIYAFLEGDRDSDGLHDDEEQAIGTVPDNPDTDYDGMPDGWEVKYGLDPFVNDAMGDLDRDGYTNIGEYNNHTDPGDPNSKPRDLYDSLIYNPGMEDGKTYPDYWQTYRNDLDRRSGWIKGVAHSGRHSIKIENTTGTDAGWNGEIITFPEPYPHTLTLGGWAKAEDVAPGGIFAILFYIEFEDGSSTWYYDDLLFRPGTHDWENIESKVTFDKAVKQIKPYCFLSYTTGTAWFDDVYAIIQ